MFFDNKYDDTQLDNELKVEKIEDDFDHELIKKAKQKVLISASVLAAIIILASIKFSSNNKETVVVNNENLESLVQDDNLIVQEETNQTAIEENIEEETVEEESSNYTGKEIDYSNVSDFYNDIVENRKNYGTFAESFQSEEDVKNLINFIYLFDSLYIEEETTISSQEEYDEIISDYYKSYASHGLEPKLNLIFKNDSYAQKKIAEAEKLAFDLKNGQGNDYTIANNYYTWFGINLCTRDNSIYQTQNNAPLIDALREQFDEYRYVGNMLEARQYQKNNVLDIPTVDVYYSQLYSDENIIVEETPNAFACPDAIDNMVSKSEEVTESKWFNQADDTDMFQGVNDKFKVVLSKGKTK